EESGDGGLYNPATFSGRNLPMYLKEAVKRLVPPRLLNKTLLTFPWLYRMPVVSYESNLLSMNGLENLRSELDKVLNLAGDVIECGSSRCGTAVIMANHLRQRGVTSKKIYA